MSDDGNRADRDEEVVVDPAVAETSSAKGGDEYSQGTLKLRSGISYGRKSYTKGITGTIRDTSDVEKEYPEDVMIDDEDPETNVSVTKLRKYCELTKRPIEEVIQAMLNASKYYGDPDTTKTDAANGILTTVLNYVKDKMSQGVEYVNPFGVGGMFHVDSQITSTPKKKDPSVPTMKESVDRDADRNNEKTRRSAEEARFSEEAR